MSHFTRVRYLRMDRNALEIVSGIGSEEKSFFIDQMILWFDQLEAGLEPEIPEVDNRLLGIALRNALPELCEGYAQYMDNVTRRKKSPIDQGCIADAPPVYPKDSSIREDSTDYINQTRSELLRDGFRDDEIDSVINKVTDWSTIKNPGKYIKACLEKKKQKAGSYQQRDFSGEDDAALKRCIEQIRKGGGPT